MLKLNNLRGLRNGFCKAAFKSALIIGLLAAAANFYGCSTTSSQSQESQSDSQSQSDSALTYTANIEPLLSQQCVRCHNPNGSAASLPLDSYASVSNSVKPGDPENSDLIKSVNGGSMSGKLSNDELQLLTNWVKQGAKE